MIERQTRSRRPQAGGCSSRIRFAARKADPDPVKGVGEEVIDA